MRQKFRDTLQKTQHVALNAHISMSNRYYCAIMHNYVVLIYNLCITLFLHSLLNKLFARSCFSQNQLNLLVEKMDKKQSLSTEKWDQIVTLSNLKFSVREIAKMKVSKTAVHNAIMKYQNKGVFINKKSLYLYVPTSMSLEEAQTFLLHRLSQAWLSGWLA